RSARAEGLDAARDRRRHAVLVHDVALERLRLRPAAAQLGRGPLRQLAVNIEEADIRPLAREALGDGPTDPLRGAPDPHGPPRAAPPRHRAPSARSADGTRITGAGASRTSCSATLPSSQRSTP